jgi:hypothetical protein
MGHTAVPAGARVAGSAEAAALLGIAAEEGDADASCAVAVGGCSESMEYGT